MRYFLIFILNLVNSQQVVYQLEAADQPDGLSSIDNIYQDDQWVIVDNQNGLTRSTCNSVDVYGGYEVFTHDTVIQKYFTLLTAIRVFFDLGPHFKMRIEMNLWWFNLVLEELIIENDNTQINITSSSSLQTRSCPELTSNSIIIEYQVQCLIFEFSHQRRNSIFKMFQAYFELEDATWGFNSFKISVYNCPSGCLQCIGEDDLNCGLWSKLQFSFIQCEFEDSDIQQWGGGLEVNVDEFGCCKGINSISFENSFILPPSDKILIRFLINKNTDLTIWIDQNRINIQQAGVVELIVQKQFGQTLNVKIRDLNSLSDWMIRDLEIYYQLRHNYIDNIISYIILECRQLIGQFCFDCQEGWELDVLQNICMTSCGDNIISGLEECDDGNYIQFDGCYQCKFQCIQFCLTCIHGACLQCSNGYSFNNNQECSLNCQDKIIIPYYNQECEGQDFNQFHGCFQCLNQLECIYGCEKCDLGTCYRCQSDFILYQGKCYSNCGRDNGIVYEDCEDINEDNIELLCQPYCITCNLKQCLMCDEQYELLEDGSCVLKDVDNINQLIQKVDMICQKSSFECNYYKSPQLILSYLNITLNKQYVRIEFTEQVKSQLQTPLSETLIIEILNITNQMYSYDVIIIQDSGEFVQTLELILEIEIFELLEKKPVLSLNLNQSLVNSFGQGVIQDSAIITLELPSYLNENQKRTSNKLASITESSIYGLLAVCGISVLFGNLQYILGILNMLQYLSILRIQKFTFRLMMF
ncbi:unnamed protein product [Paramecium octaurelia]|uniref:Insulin-like growth factor binding protein, N-terminal n=1 Tax=Paramecium octaurelia TaxID=43137 RepID=A0A8S1YAT7_PAROT|nr:unnamed protein product [Paramecium octaurelia]